MSKAFSASIVMIILPFFQFVNIAYHNDSLVYIEESLHSWNKHNLIIVYELLTMLLNSARILLRIFASVFTSDFGL